MNPLSRLIAWRFLFSSRQRFVPLLTFVALSGIALGVWSLLVVLSVMRGFQGELNQRWIGLNSHLTISKLALKGETYEKLLENLKTWREIEDVAPYADGEVIIHFERDGRAESVAAKVKGVSQIDSAFVRVAKIYPAIIPDWNLLEKGEEPPQGEPPLMGGEEVLSTLGVHPDLEDSVTLIYPFGEIGPTGDWVPKQKKFQVTHVFRTGLYNWDSLRVLVPLEDAIQLLGDQGETGLQIRLKDLGDLPSVEKKIKAIVPPNAEVSSFAEQNKRLFSALKLERMAMTLLLVLFGLIASFSIVGLMLMFVDARKRDLAILRAVGLSVAGSRKIFLMIGGLLGGLGALIGGSLGVATCFVLHKFPIPLPSTYYLDYLPVQVQLFWSVAIMAVGFLLTLLVSCYPVHLASQMDVLPMLREE